MLAALTAIALAAAPAEPPLSQVLAQAAASGKPVFLDVYTSWCVPCRILEKKVLPSPQVKRALKGYQVQRYDAEKGHGVEVAQRYSINEYPTLLVLNPDGVQVARVRWLSVDGLARALDEWRPVGAARGRFTAGEAPRESDPAYLLVSGLLADRAGRTGEARALYDKAEALDAGDAKGIASRAAFRKLRRELSQTLVRNRGASLLELARKYPRGELAVRALGGLAQLAPALRPPLEQIRETAAAVLQGLRGRKDDLALDALCWSLLDLGLHDLALEAARAAQVASPYELDHVMAEAGVLQATGHRDEAIALLKKGLKVEPGHARLEWALAQAYQNQPFAREREATLFSD